MRSSKVFEKALSLSGWYEAKEALFNRVGLPRFCNYLENKTVIRPDHITILNLFVGLLSVAVLFSSHPALFSGLVVLQLILDNLDGYYARISGMTEGVGKNLDHGADFLIGVLILIKSWWFFGDWWILLALVLFCFEGGFLYLRGLTHDKFPSRFFMLLFIFGWYRFGLIAQLFVQPISFSVFWWGRLRRARVGYNK